MQEVIASRKMWHIALGDSLAVLKTLPDACVQCCVTSPPYYGLRDYQVDGQIGLEETPEEYVAKLAGVFRETKRVLRYDGTLWLNLGDSFNGYMANQYATSRPFFGPGKSKRTDDLTAKDMLGIPWRVAFALQADGWVLRTDIVFAKPAPMPESVRDRPTRSHEYIFLFSKQERYFYDQNGWLEPFVDQRNGHPGNYQRKNTSGIKNHRTHINTMSGNGPGKNLRSVWRIASEPSRGKHYAAFPSELPARCIALGTSSYGCCSRCLAPYARAIDKKKLKRERPNDLVKRNGAPGTGNMCPNTVAGVEAITIGWRKTCECDNETTVPCLVLDMFVGSGTTVLQAARMGRRGLGIDLSPEYVDMANNRINNELGLFANA